MSTFHYAPRDNHHFNKYFGDPLRQLNNGAVGLHLRGLWRAFAPHAVRYYARWLQLAATAYSAIPTLVVHFEALLAAHDALRHERPQPSGELKRLLNFLGFSPPVLRAVATNVKQHTDTKRGSHSYTLPLDMRNRFAEAPGIPSYLLAVNFFDEYALSSMASALEDEVRKVVAEGRADSIAAVCDPASAEQENILRFNRAPAECTQEKLTTFKACGGKWLCQHLPLRRCEYNEGSADSRCMRCVS